MIAKTVLAPSCERPLAHLKTGILLLLLVATPESYGQPVIVGQGSYSTTLPPGAAGVRNAARQPIAPKVSPAFSLPVQSNDFWSSLIFPFYGVAYSNVMYAHPLNAKAVASGLQMGYTSSPVFAAKTTCTRSRTS